MALVAADRNFVINLVKSLFILWLLALLVVIIAVFCSTFVSWPIAIVLTLVILLAHWGVEQLGGALDKGTAGRTTVSQFKISDPSSSQVVAGTVEFRSMGLRAAVGMPSGRGEISSNGRYRKRRQHSAGKGVRRNGRDLLLRPADACVQLYDPTAERGGAMTNSTLDLPTSSRARAVKYPTRRPHGRIGTVLVLIGSLLCAGLLRQVAATRQAELVNIRGTATARSTLGNMDSFALALLLGGLRGPLIMFLWPAIENQKADHDLQSVDTMIEWVRLLQPEFDSVHLFQIWNKAYNLSAMMASPANKYTVIMEAIDYAGKVDQEKPGDLNILGAMSNVYGGKFGSTNLPEFAFYGKQFRQETMTDANRARAYPEETKHFQRLYKSESLVDENTHQWEPWLDENNNIRPSHLTPTQKRPDDVPADAEWNDGSALQYLKQYNPFPYGISPLAMSYNYAKPPRLPESAEGQKPLQLSSMVIDSQPALQLKFWEEDDARHARGYEARAFKISPVGGAKQTEAALASSEAGRSNR